MERKLIFFLVLFSGFLFFCSLSNSEEKEKIEKEVSKLIEFCASCKNYEEIEKDTFNILSTIIENKTKSLPYLIKGIRSNNSKIKYGCYRAIAGILARMRRDFHIKRRTLLPWSNSEIEKIPQEIRITIEKTLNIAVEEVNNKNIEPAVRRQIIHTLTYLGSEKAISALKKCLEDPEPVIRFSATFSLRWIEDKKYSYIKAITGKEPKTPEEYAEYLKKRDEWGLYREASYEIKKFGKKAIPVLINLAKSNQEPGRCMAIDILGEMKAEEAIPLFINYLKEETKDETMYTIQIYCAGSLIEMDTEKSINTLFKYGLKHKNPKIRYYTAERLLEANKIEKRYPTLERIVKERKEEVKKVLKELGEKEDSEMKFKVAILLVRNKEKEGIPFLIELLKDKRYYGLAKDWLESITKQKFGDIPPVASKKLVEKYINKWKKWWKENKDSFKLKQ